MMEASRRSLRLLREEIATADGHRIGLLTLNAEKALNTLTLDMIDGMQHAIDLWRDDPQLVAVILQGAGDRAFCAGADIRALRESSLANPGGPCTYAEDFFAREYRLDYQLHQYAKPIICWGNGVVMGGGLGLLQASSHRVLTETARLAMPEVTIGLFPDVGGSWFLNRLPGNAGLFMGLTGAPLNAVDGLYAGLADHLIEADMHEQFLAAMVKQPWTTDSAQNWNRVSQLLTGLGVKSAENLPKAQLEPAMEFLSELCSGADGPAVIERISAAVTDNSWVKSAAETLKRGSPLAALCIYQQLKRASGMTLADVFQSELVLATQLVRHPDFAEGVRALIVDKDRSPQWQHQGAAQVSQLELEAMFHAPQTGADWPLKSAAKSGSELTRHLVEFSSNSAGFGSFLLCQQA